MSSLQIGLFFGVESLDSTGADPRIHEVPLCCVLYNKNFKQVSKVPENGWGGCGGSLLLVFKPLKKMLDRRDGC